MTRSLGSSFSAIRENRIPEWEKSAKGAGEKITHESLTPSDVGLFCASGVMLRNVRSQVCCPIGTRMRPARDAGPRGSGERAARFFSTFAGIRQAYLLKKNNQEAVQAYEKCIELELHHENALYGLSQSYKALGQAEKSKAFLAKFKEAKKMGQEQRYWT